MTHPTRRTPTWDDILLSHADRMGRPVAISPTVDEAVVEAARIKFLTSAAGKPTLHAYAAELAVQYFAEQIAGFRAKVEAAYAAQVQTEKDALAELVRSREIEASLAAADAYSRANPGSGVTS